MFTLKATTKLPVSRSFSSKQHKRLEAPLRPVWHLSSPSSGPPWCGWPSQRVPGTRRTGCSGELAGTAHSQNPLCAGLTGVETCSAHFTDPPCDSDARGSTRRVSLPGYVPWSDTNTAPSRARGKTHTAVFPSRLFTARLLSSHLFDGYTPNREQSFSANAVGISHLLLTNFFQPFQVTIPHVALTPSTLVNVTIVLQTGSDCRINTIQKGVAINSGAAKEKKNQVQRRSNSKNTFCSGEEKPTPTQNKTSSNKPHSFPSINSQFKGESFGPSKSSGMR